MYMEALSYRDENNMLFVPCGNSSLFKSAGITIVLHPA